MDKEYLIADYRWTKRDHGEPRLYRMNELEMFQLVDTAKREGAPIVIFRIGACLLDWSWESLDHDVAPVGA